MAHSMCCVSVSHYNIIITVIEANPRAQEGSGSSLGVKDEMVGEIQKKDMQSKPAKASICRVPRDLGTVPSRCPGWIG